MKSYSEIINPNITPQDEVITDFCQRSGMKRSYVARLFESQKFAGLKTSEIKKTFDDMLETDDKVTIDLTKGSVSCLEDYSVKALQIVNEYVKKNPFDGVGILNLVANFMAAESTNLKHKVEKIDIYSKIPEILEGARKSLNESIREGKNTQIKLYESLKNFLQYNSGMFEFSYHVQSTYELMWHYLDDEIKALTNDQYITSKSDTYIQEFITNVLRDNLNPMYKSLDVIKARTSDLQTLVFDTMCLIWCWSEMQDKRVFQMVRKSTYRDFVKATENLATAIWQSRPASKFLAQVNLEDKVLCAEGCCNATGYIESGATSRLLNALKEINPEFQPYMKNWNLEIKNLYFCAEVIKNCGVEFNMQTRPYLREFVTKTWSLLQSCDHVINGLNTMNNFKNF